MSNYDCESRSNAIWTELQKTIWFPDIAARTLKQKQCPNAKKDFAIQQFSKAFGHALPTSQVCDTRMWKEDAYLRPTKQWSAHKAMKDASVVTSHMTTHVHEYYNPNRIE